MVGVGLGVVGVGDGLGEGDGDGDGLGLGEGDGLGDGRGLDTATQSVSQFLARVDRPAVPAATRALHQALSSSPDSAGTMRSTEVAAVGCSLAEAWYVMAHVVAATNRMMAAIRKRTGNLLGALCDRTGSCCSMIFSLPSGHPLVRAAPSCFVLPGGTTMSSQASDS